MSSIDEYSARIGAAIQVVEQARTSVGQAKSDGEDLAGQFEGMGAEAMGATIRSSVDQGGEADGVLVEAINKLKEMQSTAESVRGNGLRGGGGDATPPESTWRNEIGDQLQPGPASPHRGFMKQELKSNDDDDKSKSRMNRFGRSMARNIESAQTQGKDTTASIIGQVAARDPVETVGVPQSHGGPEISHNDAAVPVQDVVANALLMSAFAVEGLSRLFKRKKNRDK
ncbi:MAG TPA: hypothetical protein VE172_24345 [Stackebrandtia sp.]|uniref:hypothetical protein n=1 Tax=Stackebrandtia sp. TaxID=2023065 RepID=UPI002D74BD70|nr:hypothetical protein [Stackebrandtia sp.]HZE41941.1 hypothetical protein [Stackebrandtia sp.]